MNPVGRVNGVAGGRAYPYPALTATGVREREAVGRWAVEGGCLGQDGYRVVAGAKDETGALRSVAAFDLTCRLLGPTVLARGSGQCEPAIREGDAVWAAVECPLACRRPAGEKGWVRKNRPRLRDTVSGKDEQRLTVPVDVVPKP